MFKKISASAAGLSALALALGGFMISPAHADPNDIKTVVDKLKHIQEESSALEAKIIQFNKDIDTANKNIAQTDVDIKKQQVKVENAKNTLSSIGAYQFYSRDVSPSIELVTANNPGDFLSAMGTINLVSSNVNASLQDYQSAESKLQKLKKNQEDSLTKIKVAKDKIKVAIADYAKKEDEAKKTLARLTPSVQKKVNADNQFVGGRVDRPSRSTRQKAAVPPVVEAPPVISGSASDRALRAVEIVKAQLGKNYVFGATGPNVFDCSGLMLYAYRQVGISLSRTSQEQAHNGSHVTLAAIQPGDLVIYYSGRSHVGMYIGGGKVLHASNPRRGIKIDNVTAMPINEIRRVA